MRRTSLLWLLSLLLCIVASVSAQAETASYSFTDKGVRIYLPSEWEVLTPANLEDQSATIQKMGTTREALSANFAETGTLLETFLPTGGQIRVQCAALPTGIQPVDAFAMTPGQRDAFLQQMVQVGGFDSGIWSDSNPEFAIFRGSTAIQTLSIKTIAYTTVRYGMLFTISQEIIGREPTQADEDSVSTVVSSLLFLGAPVVPQPTAEPFSQATLEPSPAGTPVPAEIKVQRDEVPLTLDYAPSVTNLSSLQLTGQTEPNTPMRYYVNGQGYERFTAGADGRFTVDIRNLPKDGKNLVAIYAIGDKGYGVVAFTVLLDKAKVPMAVTQLTQGIEGNQAMVTGTVQPGASVQVLYRNKAYDASVKSDGSFSSLVELPKMGNNQFTVRAALDGYLRNDEKLTIIRLPSDVDKQEAFLKAVKKVAYEKLVEKSESFLNIPVQYQGQVKYLSGLGGQPLAVIDTQSGQNLVAVLCDNLSGIELDQDVYMLCTLTGAMRVVSLPSGPATLPEARLNWLLPQK